MIRNITICALLGLLVASVQISKTAKEKTDLLKLKALRISLDSAQHVLDSLKTVYGHRNY